MSDKRSFIIHQKNFDAETLISFVNFLDNNDRRFDLYRSQSDWLYAKFEIVCSEEEETILTMILGGKRLDESELPLPIADMNFANLRTYQCAP